MYCNPFFTHFWSYKWFEILHTCSYLMIIEYFIVTNINFQRFRVFFYIEVCFFFKVFCILLLGIWTGHHDYFDHTAAENPGWGLDMRRNMNVAYDLHGKYSTDVFTEEAVNIISKHNKTQPLFLYVSHVAVHSGNGYNPLPAPDEIVAKFDNITNYNRRRFAGRLFVC